VPDSFLPGRYASCASIGIPEVPYDRLALRQNVVASPHPSARSTEGWGEADQFSFSKNLSGLSIIDISNYKIF
jgi:hypothetical protein